MIKLTEDAVNHIENLLKREGKDGYGLRVAVLAGGCSGLTYDLTFEELPKDNDSIFVGESGLSVFIDKKSLPYVTGMTIDYNDGLSEAGWIFDNPNAKRTCGCGVSFS